MSTRRLISGIGTAILFVTLISVFTGCVGYVDGDGGAVVVGPPPPPDVVIFGGDYDRGRDVHGWSHRGHESRDFDHGHGGGWHH